MVALAIVALILLALTVEFFVEEYGARRPVRQARLGWLARPVPLGLLLDPTHVWLKREKDRLVRLGSDGLVVAMLGEPDAVKVLARPGHIDRGDALAEVSAQGRTLTLRSPLSGMLIECNAGLNPEAVAQDPFGHGWLALVRPREEIADVGRVRGERAREFLAREWERARELVADLTRAASPVGATMADGGTLQPGFLRDLPAADCQLLERMFFMASSSLDADEAVAGGEAN